MSPSNICIYVMSLSPEWMRSSVCMTAALSHLHSDAENAVFPCSKRSSSSSKSPWETCRNQEQFDFVADTHIRQKMTYTGKITTDTQSCERLIVQVHSSSKDCGSNGGHFEFVTRALNYNGRHINCGTRDFSRMSHLQ